LCFCCHKNIPPDMSGGQTCLLRPMVAKGEMEEMSKEVMMEATVKTTEKRQANQPKNKGGAPKKKCQTGVDHPDQNVSYRAVHCRRES